jgi:hypothetical protein
MIKSSVLQQHLSGWSRHSVSCVVWSRVSYRDTCGLPKALQIGIHMNIRRMKAQNTFCFLTWMASGWIQEIQIQRFMFCVRFVHHHPDDGDSTHLWNVGILQRHYTAPYTRRLSSSHSLRWASEISHTVSIFMAENGDNMFLQNVRIHMASQPTKSTSLPLPPW